MLRPLPIVLALFALASAMAQEAPPDGATTLSTADDAKPMPKKTPASTEARKSAPTQLVMAEPTTTSGKARRVTFVNHKEKEVPPPPEMEAPPEKPLTFWERIFGRRKPRAVAPAPMTPEPVATPKPVVRVRKFVKLRSLRRLRRSRR